MVVTCYIPDAWFSKGTKIRHMVARMVGPERDTTISVEVLNVAPDYGARKTLEERVDRIERFMALVHDETIGPGWSYNHRIRAVLREVAKERHT